MTALGARSASPPHLDAFRVPSADMDQDAPLIELQVPGTFSSPEEAISMCHNLTVPCVVYPFSEGSQGLKTQSFGTLTVPLIAKCSRVPWKPAAGVLCLDDSDSEGSSDTDMMAPMASLDDCDDLVVPSVHGGGSLTDRMLIHEWDERAEQGLFRYDVTQCETKVTPGVYAFVLQLNEGRANKKRATEFAVDQVVQAFAPGKFNFTKAAMKEVLFEFTAGPVARATARADHACGASPNLVLINVSPIEVGHVLLVPRANDGIPQLVDQTTLLFALQFAKEVGNPFFRLGYNSLGAFGTINHLHFQGYYLNRPYPVERAPTAPIPGFPEKVRGVQVSRLQAYPVEGWVFEAAANCDSLAALVGALCMKLQILNTPHNLLVCDMGSRVILWPQAFAERQARGEVPEDLLDMGVNPAAFEIAGHLVLKRAQDYESLDQETAWKLLAHVSLTPDSMDALQAQIFAGFV